MANTKISDLPSTTTLTNEDAIPVVQEGVTKKFTGVLVALKTLLGIGEPSKLQTQSKEVVGAVNELNGKTPGAGLADFDGDDPEDAALLMYKYGDANWAGIGASPSGNVQLSFGVNSRYKYEFATTGIYLGGKRVSDPGIIKLTASQTILATFISQAESSVQHYTYGVTGVPEDYPQALKDAGVSFCPVMTILKASAAVGMILIQDAQSSSGAPHAILGYITTTRVFWGDML